MALHAQVRAALFLGGRNTRGENKKETWFVLGGDVGRVRVSKCFLLSHGVYVLTY